MRAMMCAALIALGAQGVAAQDVTEVESIVLSNAEHTLWHEAAHLLIAELGLPVIGQEEDAADSFATLMMLENEDPDAIEYVLDVAELWLVSHERNEADGDETAYYYEHDLDVQRGLRVICFIAGAGPGRAHDMIADWGLPEDRADSCVEDYELALESWETVLEPHRNAVGSRGARIEVSYGDGAGRMGTLIRDAELLETVAEELSARYDLPNDLAMTAETCDEASAFWDPQVRRATICYELIEEFADLAVEAIATRSGE